MYAVLDRLAGSRRIRPARCTSPRESDWPRASSRSKPPRDQDHHRRRNARIGDVTASRAFCFARSPALSSHLCAAAAVQTRWLRSHSEIWNDRARQRELRLRQLQEQQSAIPAPLPAVDVRRVAGDDGRRCSRCRGSGPDRWRTPLMPSRTTSASVGSGSEALAARASIRSSRRHEANRVGPRARPASRRRARIRRVYSSGAWPQRRNRSSFPDDRQLGRISIRCGWPA